MDLTHLKKDYLKSFIFFSIILLTVTTCTSSTEPFDGSDVYMTLNVGDIRQYCMPYSRDPQIYTVWKIAGRTHRSDGTEVFVGEWYYYNYDNKYTAYYFIRDGFFYYTELDCTSTSPGNPYFEQRLAKIQPTSGDSWLQIIGYLNPDSSKDYLTAKYLGQLNTPAGKFKDVYSFVSSRGIMGTEVSEIYYAKHFGHIGYAVIGDSSSMFLVNYMKIKGTEVGKYVEMGNAKPNNNRSLYEQQKPFFLSKYER